jgi:DNA polymerase I-like protein with 3'-5' exonuclease and polymerase domains
LWEKYLSVNPEWRLVANVHDEAVLEVPEADKDEAQIVLKECMESAAYEVMLVEVPIVADAGCGTDWSAK